MIDDPLGAAPADAGKFVQMLNEVFDEFGISHYKSSKW
jgi:hypothetical protein